MKRRARLSAGVIAVVLVATAAGSAAAAFASDAAPGAKAEVSTTSQEMAAPDSHECPSGGDVDAMRMHMDALHGAGSFDAMHASSGGMMSGWTDQ